jgi:hypothetical protein
MDARDRRGDVVPLPRAAHQLGWSWHRAYRAVLSGELVGEQRAGRWVVFASSLERAEGKRSAPNRRRRDRAGHHGTTA